MKGTKQKYSQKYEIYTFIRKNHSQIRIIYNAKSRTKKLMWIQVKNFVFKRFWYRVGIKLIGI